MANIVSRESIAVQKLHRAKFIQKEQAMERQVTKLTEELNEKMTFAIVKYARGQDGTISTADQPSLDKEIQLLMFWFAGQLETIIRNGMTEAASTALESERQSHLIYLKKALDIAPLNQRKEIMDKWAKLGRKMENAN